MTPIGTWWPSLPLGPAPSGPTTPAASLRVLGTPGPTTLAILPTTAAFPQDLRAARAAGPPPRGPSRVTTRLPPSPVSELQDLRLQFRHWGGT